MPDLYYLSNSEGQSGPYIMAQLATMWQNGAVTADAYFWKEGMAQWELILTIEGQLNPPPAAKPPPLPTIAPKPPPLPPSTLESKQVAVKSSASEKDYSLTIAEDGKIHLSANSLNGAKQGLQELKLQKKAFQLEKKNLQLRAKQTHQSYTSYTSKRGHMFRGGRTMGRLIRIFQSADRDAHQRQLANSLRPIEGEINRIEKILIALDEAITKLTYTIQNYPS